MDNILLLVFGVLSVVAFVIGLVAFTLALKYARKSDGEGKMVAWAFVGLAGIVFSGMSWAYFLIPILVRRYF